MLFRSNKIYVDDSPVQGRGVFTSEKIKKGEILEECHFFLVPISNYHPTLHEHFFSYPKDKEESYAICLGFGSIFNSSPNGQNADWEVDRTKHKMIFFAIRDIEPGEEIFTSYNNGKF